MKIALILAAVFCTVTARQVFNDDEVLDEMNYRSNTRTKRALCGSSQTGHTTRYPFAFPTMDPRCFACNCFIMSKRNVASSIISPINPIGPIGPIRPGCDYTRCCLGRNPWSSAGSGGLSPSVSTGKAASSLSDASINDMASNLINSFGKRAASAGDAKFKKPSVDLVFLIDDSGSIPSAQFTVAKEGAAVLSQALCPREFGSGKGQKQVSVVLFSTTAKTVLSFDDSQKGSGYVEDAILGMKQRSGTTATVDAIKHVRDNVLGGPGSRLNDPDTATIVFVITDGKCNQRNCNELGSKSKQLRQTGPGVQVFAFGVGEADCDELEAIRGKDAGQVFGLPDFDFFEKLALAVKEQMANNDSVCVSDD